jgi:low affinity Fe/Cu permease
MFLVQNFIQMKQIATIIFCMFFFAQAICSSKSHPIRAYINEHVKPALKQQRLKLEASISLEDKKQIEDLRIKLKALRANKPKGDKCSKPEQMDIQHQQRKQAKREIMKEAKLLAQKYQGQIEVLYKELEPIRIQWKADLEKLVSEQSKDTCHCQKRKPPFKRLFSPAHFILMNPNEGEAAGIPPKQPQQKPKPPYHYRFLPTLLMEFLRSILI